MSSIKTVVVALAALGLFVSGTAHGAGTDEQKCQSKLLAAKAKFTSCAIKAKAKFEASGEDLVVYNTAVAKCVGKLVAVWPKLQTKFAGTGTTCANPRFTDNGLTVTDELTGLQWAEKFDDNSVHDKDFIYPWTASATRPTGTLYTTFFATLNASPSCHGNYCDWRAPTLIELQSILSQPYPCTSSPCADPGLGLTKSGLHWTSDTSRSLENDAWLVNFATGETIHENKLFHYSIRAVRVAY